MTPIECPPDRGSAPLPSAVRIGGVSKRHLLQALRERDVKLNHAAEMLFEDDRFTTLGQRRVVEIAAVPVADLGFDTGATYGQLTERALESGLVECPLELGPHLRMQYPDQPEAADGTSMSHGRAPAGSITIAATPLDDADDVPKGFYLRRADGALWLRGYWSPPDHVWSPEDVIVFCRQL